MDSYAGPVSISDRSGRTTEIAFDRQPGRVIHILRIVTDDGTPSLNAYRRVILDLR